MPKVSVLMTNYNAGEYIGEAIESILWQTFTDFELVIVDDGSGDGSWNIIQKYSHQDTRIRCYQNEKNLWISLTRNRLIDLAQWEYLAWLDSDDIAEKRRLLLQVDFLEKNPDYGIVGSWMTLVNKVGEEMGVRKLPVSDSEIRDSFYFRTPVSLGCQMLSKKYRKKIGYYNTELESAEDLDFLLRASRYCKLANIPDTLIRYRLHGTNVSLKKQKQQIRNTLLVRKNIEKMGYKMGLVGKCVQCVTWCMQFLPASFVMRVFNYGIIKIEWKK